MIERSTPSARPSRSSPPIPEKMRPALTTGVAFAALLIASVPTHAQTSAAPPPEAAAPASQTQPQTLNLSNPPVGKTRKEDKVVPSKDTKKEEPKYKKDNPLEGVDAKLPDKELYDKAMDAIKRGHFDVARLDLQTLLNTYQDSQFEMRAKLAIADSWYKEGGTAALTQAEQEYRDFITFFPNAPEAAEAQMRIGDIYFREMDKPDRDNTKAVHAQENYRLMLQQFPESERIPEAMQRLREVDEQLASAEADVAAFYAGRQNWVASVARYQTIADTYPLYSHMDDVLVGLGDGYEAQARFYRTAKIPGFTDASRERLVSIYEHQAAAAYSKVVLEHSAAAHVEDARDRLAAMGLPIPVPTPEQVAASETLENSRGHYTLSNRATVFLLHKADTVLAATTGQPPLEDAKPTVAPTIVKQNVANFYAAVNPPASVAPAAAPAPTAVANTEPASPASAPVAAAPLAFQSIPAAGSGAATAAVTNLTPASSMTTSSGGGGVGMEIVQPSANSPATPPSANPTAFPGSTPAPQSATPQTATPAPAVRASAANGGIGPVGPTNNTALAPIEKAPAAPDAITAVAPGSQPAAQAAAAAGSKTAKPPACDKANESCSTHKKKKGLARLIPF
jgi:outer membrane protein assembly factor BamD